MSYEHILLEHLHLLRQLSNHIWQLWDKGCNCVVCLQAGCFLIIRVCAISSWDSRYDTLDPPKRDPPFSTCGFLRTEAIVGAIVVDSVLQPSELCQYILLYHSSLSSGSSA
eukprot:1978854-Rhodomonas_salina.2